MTCHVAPDFIQMLLVVDGRGDDFAGICDRAAEDDVFERDDRRAGRNRPRGGDHGVEVGDQQIAC